MKLLIVLALGLLASSCSIEFSRRTSPGYYDEEHAAKAFSEIYQAASASSAEVLAKFPLPISSEIEKMALKHFEVADAIAKKNSAISRDRLFGSNLVGLVIAKSGKVDASLKVVRAPHAFAIAYPNGRLIASESLVGSFMGDDRKIDPVLLGIFLHELVHIYEGHATMQWLMADRRKHFIESEFADAWAAATKIIPGFTYKRDVPNFDSAVGAGEMPVWSEYAADMKVLSMLKASGIDETLYTAFLKSRSKRSDATQNLGEPFTWLPGRVACLERLAKQDANGIKDLVVGDSISQVSVSLAEEKGFAGEPDERFPWRMHFIACVIEKTMPAATIQQGTLRAPYFGWFLFD